MASHDVAGNMCQAIAVGDCPESLEHLARRRVDRLGRVGAG